MAIKKLLTIFYTRLAYLFVHRGMDEENARTKAYTKTLLLAGVLFFFIYAFLMNMFNQMFFNFPNTRAVGYFFIGTFVIIFYLVVGERILKPRLRSINLKRDINKADIEKIKKFYNKVLIFVFVYAVSMFVLIRCSNILWF